MACARRSLASGFPHLSRRLHPSFPHLLPADDRDASPKLPPLPPPPPRIPAPCAWHPPRFAASRPLDPRCRLGLHLPLGLDPSLRRYSSSTEGSNEITYIKDVAEVLLDTSGEATAVVPVPFAGEVAAAAANSFPPVAALQYLIDGVHSFTGLNWWASIALTTLLIRGATLPLLINQMKATAKLNILRPELEELKQEMQNSVDPQSLQEGQKRMRALFEKHGVTPFTPFKGLLIQGPIFISFFFAISNMVEKVPSFKGGGAFWFTDLTTPDHLYAFPVLTSLIFLATVEFNMQEGMEGNPMAKTMKNFSRLLALLTVPFTASFPKGVFCYWITSNMFSLIYGFVIRRPSVRKFLDIPDIPPQPNSPAQPSFSFFGESKPVAPVAPSQAKQIEEPKPAGRRVSSSTVISHRIRNLEKTVKARRKPKKR